jgi:hypothetical protein
MNKDVLQAVILGLLVAYTGYRIYTKYFRKDGNETFQPNKNVTSISSSKDDDYEPYLKK